MNNKFSNFNLLSSKIKFKIYQAKIRDNKKQKGLTQLQKYG